MAKSRRTIESLENEIQFLTDTINDKIAENEGLRGELEEWRGYWLALQSHISDLEKITVMLRRIEASGHN